MLADSLHMLQSTHFSFSRFLTRQRITEALPGSRRLAILAKEHFTVGCVSASTTTSGGLIQIRVQVIKLSQIPGATYQALIFPQTSSYGVLFLQHHVDMTTGSEVCRAAEASTEGPFRAISSGGVLLNGFVSHTSNTVLI